MGAGAVSAVPAQWLTLQYSAKPRSATWGCSWINWAGAQVEGEG